MEMLGTIIEASTSTGIGEGSHLKPRIDKVIKKCRSTLSENTNAKANYL